jgi:RimJ/RimL family protein N-acetyltransferase
VSDERINRDDLMAGLPPELQEQIRRSQAAFRIAESVSAAIAAAEPGIADLSVAFADDTASLSGIGRSQASVDRAVEIAATNSNVAQVHSSIVLAPIETERMLLRPWRESDAAFHHRLWTERDPRVPAHRRIDANGHPTVDELRERLRHHEQVPAPGLLVAELKDSGEAIGYCGLIPNTYGQPDEPELAYELLRDAWGNGYATEAALAVVERATAEGYPRLWATVRDWNTASRRVLSKLGFVETGRVEPDALHGDSLFTAKTL